jgi:hypothetical protein
MQALKALEEPLLEKKICVRNTNPANRKANEEDLRRSLENALKYRNTKIILIDEAQHIGKVTNSKHLQSHMDCLKGLIDETNTKHILFGTFEMLTFRTNGQISRRARELHFKRYKYTSESDKNHFMEALLTFQKHLPIEKEPELLDYFEDIYASSVGCIGSVKNILYEALYLALIEGKSTITKETLEKAALSSAACNTIAREAIENEMIIDKNNDKQTLRKTLGMFDESPINNTAKKGKAVKRNPKRDIVGTDVV